MSLVTFLPFTHAKSPFEKNIRQEGNDEYEDSGRRADDKKPREGGRCVDEDVDVHAKYALFEIRRHSFCWVHHVVR